MHTKKFYPVLTRLIYCLALIICIPLLPCFCFAQDPCRSGGGDLCDFGVPKGAVFEFNESYITEAIRNAWDANGMGSPRGAFSGRCNHIRY